MIPEQLIQDFEGTLKNYSKDHAIFNEGAHADFYYQIKTGHVKMFNLTEDGKEFVQGFFENGNSFGEPPLFGAFKYPATALTLAVSEVYVLPKSKFLKLLKAHPDIHLKFTKMICKRMIYKAKIAREVSIYPPEHRILTLLHHLKANAKIEVDFEVPLTRQQISELTGLRVETVIRAIKKLEKSKALAIIDRKVVI
ncbi:CRP-like cAMP-binding protein [Gelidibacter algens]|uniref:CRP-like cAMP-binding protein n=1 Tax=Gelidibacter algens TaxID=49280 RepID=A0A1A7QUF6_9FLAO|nr:Crp/Fnr family transcriptional regulator [Gelidibacter algens]OBX23151.1 cyclic nucleotide-binding protein [Gelidibacter algens]RAJ27617.1 CRP-like cAMP-binding protein [Gelidibacter algens]